MPAALASCSALGHGRGVRGRHGDAVDALGDQVGDDLHLLVAAAMLAGADEVHSTLSAPSSGDGLLAAELGLVEERIVEVLRHHREVDQLVGGAAPTGEDRAGDDCTRR